MCADVVRVCPCAVSSEEKMAWDVGDDDDVSAASSILFGTSSRPKGLDMEREKRTQELGESTSASPLIACECLAR